jgi:hypothetical protein
MDYETILERARAEAGAKTIAAFARGLANEWCEVYGNVAQPDKYRALPMWNL